jgi:hypothetical protein
MNSNNNFLQTKIQCPAIRARFVFNIINIKHKYYVRRYGGVRAD